MQRLRFCIRITELTARTHRGCMSREPDRDRANECSECSGVGGCGVHNCVMHVYALGVASYAQISPSCSVLPLLQAAEASTSEESAESNEPPHLIFRYSILLLSNNAHIYAYIRKRFVFSLALSVSFALPSPPPLPTFVIYRRRNDTRELCFALLPNTDIYINTL